MLIWCLAEAGTWNPGSSGSVPRCTWWTFKFGLSAMQR